MNSPWLANVVLATMVISILGYVAVSRSISALREFGKTFRGFAKDVTKAALSLHGLILLMHRIEQEMIYMRTLTQQAAQVQNLDSRVEQQPPLGRVGQMPPPFPTPEWANAPDAKLEDTDKGLLDQTEEDLRDAQVREELAARGINLSDYDAGELPAVVEEA